MASWTTSSRARPTSPPHCSISSEPGDIKAYLGESTYQMRAQQFGPDGTGGMMKGSELAQSFASLRANDLIWNYVVNNYLKGQDPRSICCSGTAIPPICGADVPLLHPQFLSRQQVDRTRWHQHAGRRR